PSKDLFPGYFCASASGHVASGEAYETSAQRETQEELGITPRLSYVGKALVRSQPETEMAAIFLARSDGPYHFHPTETAGGALLPWGAIQRGRHDGSLQLTPALAVALDAVQRLQERGALAPFFQRAASRTG
ncbi:MAG TPA: NUDIX domain-containing protein, partial [Ktedonobacterales bacterium]